jgi:hypothetical protein
MSRTSERIMQRTVVERAARQLAQEVASHLVCPTQGSAEAMHVALLAYTEARTKLDG